MATQDSATLSTRTGGWGRGTLAAPRALRRRLLGVPGCALALLVLVLGCASGGRPIEACAVFNASANLNLFDGEAHPVTLRIYPLEAAAGFTGSTVADLLDGRLPAGVLAPPVPVTVEPDTKHAFSEMFPAKTNMLGILADYYRAPGDPEGTRKQVVVARCGLRKPKLILSPKDIYLK